MRSGAVGNLISKRPVWVIVAWLAALLIVVATAPNLSHLVAARTIHLLPRDAESRHASALVRQTWPEQASDSTIVLGIRRPAGLTPADRDYARRLCRRFRDADRPPALLRVDGPDSHEEVAKRLLSADRTTELLVVRLSAPFIGPGATETFAWLRAAAAADPPPPGATLLWSGDAVLGSVFLDNIRVTLDRAAVATVGLLLVVLLVVYRSFWLALVPLVSIGISLMITRGLLAWLCQAGWEISFLVELFLVVMLFGCGTDFGLLLTWRFAESWDREDPARVMPETLRLAREPIVTSAGTVIVGMSLMGTTRFPLFSSTGPSIGLGLFVTLASTMTLTPALLVLLARRHPRSFKGLLGRSSGLWDGVGARVLARPLVIGVVIVAAMAVPALYGTGTNIVHNMLTDLPASSSAIRDFRQLAQTFGAGTLAPITVLIESDSDLRQSRGLALLDDVSRSLARRRRWSEVRSATQPTGDPAPLEPARIAERIDAVRRGLVQVSDGALLLQRGLNEGAAKLRLGKGLERLLPGKSAAPADGQADPRDTLIEELGRAADATGKIADGSGRSRDALAAILEDPYGREALGHLLVTVDDVKSEPALKASLDHYLSPDGHRARIELEPTDPICSAAAIDGVEALRRQLADQLGDRGAIRAHALVSGINAEWADIRALTMSDQRQVWWLVPLGVSLILFVFLRDVWTCVNLVGTMLLTYLVALGLTRLFFVWWLGADGIDWKVPYFLFILLVALGVDYNVFLMSRLREETRIHGLRTGTIRAIGRTGGLISSAAAITACSFAAFLFSPLSSLRQLGFALVIGIVIDAVLVRPVLVPCGHWLLNRRRAHESRPLVGPFVRPEKHSLVGDRSSPL